MLSISPLLPLLVATTAFFPLLPSDTFRPSYLSPCFAPFDFACIPKICPPHDSSLRFAWLAFPSICVSLVLAFPKNFFPVSRSRWRGGLPSGRSFCRSVMKRIGYWVRPPLTVCRGVPPHLLCCFAPDRGRSSSVGSPGGPSLRYHFTLHHTSVTQGQESSFRCYRKRRLTRR